MSIKNNTASLRELLEAVNNLPNAGSGENLDAEISTQTDIISEQDAKIAELAEVLAGKAGVGGNVETCEVRVNSPDMFIHYVDENQTLRLGFNDEIHKVAKNTIMICGLGEGTAVTFSGGITRQYTLTDGEDNFIVVYVSDDGAIDLEL